MRCARCWKRVGEKRPELLAMLKLEFGTGRVDLTADVEIGSAL
jgi:hypothetical protein